MKEKDYATIRIALRLVIFIVVISVDLYLVSGRQWVLLIITNLIGVLLIEAVNTIGKKSTPSDSNSINKE